MIAKKGFKEVRKWLLITAQKMGKCEDTIQVCWPALLQLQLFLCGIFITKQWFSNFLTISYCYIVV